MNAAVKAKMMPGTSSGATYFAFAKKVNVVLGIKPYGIVNGGRFNVEGTTYFMARLRSAPAGNLFADDDPEKVVKLQKAPANLWDAWPDVVWEKKSDERASTTIGIFLRGTFSREKAELEKLLGQVQDGKLTNKMADYLVELAGVDDLIVTKRELQQWLDSQYKPMIDGIVEQIAKAKQIETAMEEQVGVFGMQAAILKKVYGSTAEAEEEKPDDDKLTQDVADAEVPEDPDDNGGDESNDD
jgi:hypothetical protein